MPDGSAAASLTLEHILRPLGERASTELAQALTELRLDVAAQHRYDELATGNTAGTLDEHEREELADFVTLNRFISTLKAEAVLAQRRRAA
jgi:uroporphyrinogen-III synthase